MNRAAFEAVDLDANDDLGDESEVEADIVRFNAAGSLPPLTLVRTWRVELAKHQRLARRLGPERPVLSIAHPRGEDVHYPDTVEDWADYCLARFDAVAPTPPHLLGGWSMGGVVALGLGEKLAARGEKVALVAMFDARMPKPRPKRGARMGKMINKGHRLLDRITEYSSLPKAERRAYVGDRIRYRMDRYGKRTRRALSRTPPPGARRKRKRTDIGPLRRAVWVAYLQYRPPPSTLPVAQMWTEESREATGDVSLGWSVFLRGPLYVEHVPGNHSSMFAEPYVTTLASCLEPLLGHAYAQAAAAES